MVMMVGGGDMAGGGWAVAHSCFVRAVLRLAACGGRESTREKQNAARSLEAHPPNTQRKKHTPNTKSAAKQQSRTKQAAGTLASGARQLVVHDAFDTTSMLRAS